MSTEKLFPSIAAFLKNRAKLTTGSSGEQNSLKIENEKFPQELVAVAEQLKALTSTWNPVEFVTASAASITAEKAKVFDAYRAGEAYNPTFVYDQVNAVDIDLEQTRVVLSTLLSQVRSFKPQSEFERIAKVSLYYKVMDDLASVTLISGIQTKNERFIRTAMNTKYRPLDAETLEAAENAYDAAIEETAHPSKLEGTPLLTPEQRKLLDESDTTDQDIKNAFDWLLEQYGILKTDENPNGFSCVIDINTTSLDVRDKSRSPMTIFIPAGVTRSAMRLLQMCGHEIEAHARQSMNGLNTFVGGGPLKVDDEVLYEGLARTIDGKFHERYLGEKDNSPVMLYVVAIARAEQGANFAEIFKEQVDRHLHVLFGIDRDTAIDYTSEHVQQKLPDAMNSAWMKTYRVMRGHTDTSNPEHYAFAKDAAYFRGILMHQQLESLGYGFINEAAIMQVDALPLMGRVQFTEADVPYPYQDLTQRYCFEVLLPMLEERQNKTTAQ